MCSLYLSFIICKMKGFGLNLSKLSSNSHIIWFSDQIHNWSNTYLYNTVYTTEKKWLEFVKQSQNL